jgi:DNA-binding MarR family transcriptional regulator
MVVPKCAKTTRNSCTNRLLSAILSAILPNGAVKVRHAQHATACLSKRAPGLAEKNRQVRISSVLVYLKMRAGSFDSSDCTLLLPQHESKESVKVAMSFSVEMTDHSPASPQPQSQEKGLHAVRRLRRAFLSICRCGDVVFGPYRLTTEQYALMRAVLREPGIRQSEITDRIFAEPNTVTAMVTLLEKRGILRRKPSPADRRVRQLFLTPHGQAVMHRLSSDWRPMHEILRKYFAGEDGNRALEILDAVAERMRKERERLMQIANGIGLVSDDVDGDFTLATAGNKAGRDAHRHVNGAKSSRKSAKSS